MFPVVLNHDMIDDGVVNMNLLWNNLILMNMNLIRLYEQQDDIGVNDVDEYAPEDDDLDMTQILGYIMELEVASLA
jgi:hypothetical protein